MDSDKQIQDLAIAFARFIPILAGTAGVKAARFLTGTVKSVDEDNRLCSVEGVLDNETITYDEVNLSPERNDGFIQVPAVDSTVIVARMPDGESYVMSCSDIDKIICFIDGSNKFVFDSSGFVWNGGSFGGIGKTAAIATQLNALENRVNAMILILGTTWVPVANDGGAALKLLFTPPVPVSVPLTLTTQPGISDDAVKH